MDKNSVKWKYYKYTCNRCGWDEGWMTESNLLGGTGCSCCCSAPQTVVEGINDIPTTAPWMVKYFQGGYDEAKLYNFSSSKEINPICPDCGRIKDKKIKINAIYNHDSIFCICKDGYSYPNKLMFNLLEQLNLEFTTEYSLNWCKFSFNNKQRKGRYDFYFELNNKKYIIEMDGNWHKNDNSISGQTKEESQYIDHCKDKLAEENKVKVIRIDSSRSDMEYIKNNIIHSLLNDIFDLNTIDWLKCDEFTSTNLIKVACEYKTDNPNLTALDISKLMRVGVITIKKYLKRGTEYGWCNYNPKEEIKRGELNKIKVFCITTNEVFNSQGEANNKYNISTGNISSCCNGKRESAGKHPITGEPLKWTYYDEKIVLSNLKK